MKSSSEYVDHVNAYLLKTVEGWTLIDTGFPATSEDLVRALNDVTENHGVSEVILTHVHYDHTGGVKQVVQAFGSTVSLHSNEMKLIELTRRALNGHSTYLRAVGIEGEIYDTVRSFFARSLQLFPDSPRTFEDGEVIEGRTGRWRVVHTPGHTPGHICLYNEFNRVLISGDHLLPRETSNVPFYPIPGYAPFRSYLKSLLKVESLKPTLVLPAHGEHFSDVRSRVDYVFKHHEFRLREALESMNGWVDAVGIARGLTWSRGKFDELGPVDHWLAILEALSHAEFLVEVGLAERHRAGKIMYRALSQDVSRIEEELRKLRRSDPS